MTNEYSAITAQVQSELLTGLASTYSGIAVERRLFKPDALPTFTRYCVIISPSARPWDEDRHAMLSLQNIFRADLFALVKQWEESDAPLFGTTAGSLGLFQLVQDIKDLLRVSTLNGLIEKTYDEPGGDSKKQGAGGVQFQALASPGFESAEYTFVHRMLIPYQVRGKSFCHARAS